MANKITVVTPTLNERVQRNGLARVADSLSKQTFKDFEWLVEVNTSGETDFNQAMNKMIKRAKGDIIVSVQDFIAIEPTALEKIVELEPAFYTFPVGKILEEGETPTWDWRHAGSRDLSFTEWEICFGAAPREWLVDIGGFDEVLDQAWGFDNVNVGMRASLAKYPMKCNSDIVSVALDHDAFMEHPLKHKRDETLHNARLDDFRQGKTINYLA